jgi:hypothetical protein
MEFVERQVLLSQVLFMDIDGFQDVLQARATDCSQGT